MESWQINHIGSHLAELQSLTICNVQLLAFLKSNDVLSQEEIEQLERLGDSQRIRKASELYTILQTRLKAYEVLTKGLFEFSQNGALKILLDGYENQGIHNPFQLCGIKLNIEKLLSAPVLFQNKPYELHSWLVEQRLEDVAWKHLGGEEYFQLVQKNAEFVLFANTVPSPVPYYVKRRVEKSLHKRILKKNVFKHKSENVYLVQGVLRAQLSKLVGPTEKTCVSSVQRYKNPLTVRWILWESNDDLELISKICCVPVHHVHYEYGEFVLKESKHGTISSQFLERSESLILDEIDFVTMMKAYTSCKNVQLLDTPGMGKTEFMVHLAHELVESTRHHLVIFVKFDEFCRAIATQAFSFNAIWEQLLKLGCKSHFGRQVLTEVVQTFEVDTFVFIDRLDEVSPELQDLSIEILDCIKENREKFKIKIIICSRPHKCGIFGEKLGIDVFTLLPFNQDEQSECIIRYWENELKICRNTSIKKFAKKCLNVLDMRLNANNHVCIAGFPLQCRLIAEVYQDTVLKSETCQADVENMEMFDYSITKLYQTVVSMRLDIFDASKLEQVRKAHYRYAIESLFPDWLEQLQKFFVQVENDENVLKAGILEKLNGNIRFVHKTFAEHFLAQFLIDLIKERQTEGTHFLLNRVFTTLSYSDNVYKETITSHKFIYRVICLFLNQLINTDCIYLREISDGNIIRNFDLCYEQLLDAVTSNNLHIFRLIRKMYFSGDPETTLLQLYESRIKWTNLAIFAVKYSDVEILEECLDFLDYLPMEIPKTFSKELVLSSIQRGYYSVFEFAFNRHELQNDLDDLLDLLRTSTRDSNLLEVNERLNILEFLLDFKDKDLLLDQTDSEGNTALFEQNIHISLLVYLLEKDTKITTRANLLSENIVHSAVKYLSPDDLHRVLTLPTLNNSILSLLAMRNKKGQSALHAMIMHLEPLPETIELIKSTTGFNIDHFDNQCYPLIATAVICQREKSLLEQLVKAGSTMSDYLKNYFDSGNEIHFSIKFENLTAVEFFIEQGVDVFEKNQANKTPREYAQRLAMRDLISNNTMRILGTILQKKPRLEGKSTQYPIQRLKKRRLDQEKFKIKPYSPKVTLPDFYGANFHLALSSLSNEQKEKSSLKTVEEEARHTVASTSAGNPEAIPEELVELEETTEKMETD